MGFADACLLFAILRDESREIAHGCPCLASGMPFAEAKLASCSNDLVFFFTTSLAFYVVVLASVDSPTNALASDTLSK